MDAEIILLNKLLDRLLEKLEKDEQKNNTLITTQKSTRFSKTVLDDATSTNTKINYDSPDMEFENTFKKTVTVKSISLIPDTSFKGKGMVEIYLDSSMIFHNKQFGNFENVAQNYIQIPEGLRIDRDEKIKIYVISSDGTEIGLTAQVTFGE